MPEFQITSLRGGMNDFDPPIALADDQCQMAKNVEFYLNPCGERRRGCDAISLGSSAAVGKENATWVHRHLPTSDISAAQLWVLGYTASGGGSLALSYKDTSWHDVTIADTENAGAYYQWHGASTHGKLFTAYDSDVDRLHVWDGSTHRRAGLAQDATASGKPTAADSGGVGTLTTTRYYRQRETVQSGGVTLVRSEPSLSRTSTPDGAHASVTVTKAATVNSNATHWELEASFEKNGDYYVLATTVIGTTTVVDTTTAAAGYAAGVLSEDIGDYTPPHSPRFVLVDDDRLMLFGAFENAALDSSVSWTPTYNATGVGNDERIPLDPVSNLNLDGYAGGRITGAASAVAGEIWVGKQSGIYKLVRTGNVEAAYKAVKMSSVLGAVEGSMVEAVDEQGHPCVYFLDPSVGPCRAGRNGIQVCGKDIRTTWGNVNQAGTAFPVARGVYYQAHQQVIWLIALNPSGGTAGAPNAALVLQTNEIRATEGGEARRGFSYWENDAVEGYAICLYSDNIDTNGARNSTLVPFVAATKSNTATVMRLDTGTDDDGVAFAALITTKPYSPAGLRKQFELQNAAVVATATSGASISVSAVPDFTDAAKKTASDTVLTPVSTANRYEASTSTNVVRQLDDLSLAECQVVHLKIADVTSPTARWGLNKISLQVTGGLGA